MLVYSTDQAGPNSQFCSEIAAAQHGTAWHRRVTLIQDVGSVLRREGGRTATAVGVRRQGVACCTVYSRTASCDMHQLMSLAAGEISAKLQTCCPTALEGSLSS
jgi:hypothetical protein